MFLFRKLFTGSNVYVVLFFAFLLALGLSIYTDYGVSIDERFSDDKARINLDYITGKDDSLLKYDDRYYGAVLPIFLYEFGQLFPDSRDNLLMRHLVTFLIFYISVIFFYLLLRKVKINPALALVGTVMYVFHPHIFSHSFYNLKDIPFLNLFTICLFSLVTISEKRRLRDVITHAFLTGILVVFRQPGVFMGLITVLVFCWMLITDPTQWKKYVKIGLLYFVAALITLYVFMPVLWHDPVHELMTFTSGDLFVWNGKELFMGQFLNPAQYPWFYIPVYIGVTTPLLFTYLFMAGTGIIFYELISRKNTTASAPIFKMIGLLAFFLPLIVLIVTKPAIYNGWRHEFFLYPAFIMIAIFGMDWFFTVAHSLKNPLVGRVLSWLLTGALVVQFASVALFMIRSHPYEHVYYNILAGRTLAEARKNYCMDYWGLSYREALEDLARIDRSAQIRVIAPDRDLLVDNVKVLEPELRKRFLVVGVDEPAKYFINNFRYSLEVNKKNAKIISKIEIEGALINATYQFK